MEHRQDAPESRVASVPSQQQQQQHRDDMLPPRAFPERLSEAQHVRGMTRAHTAPVQIRAMPTAAPVIMHTPVAQDDARNNPAVEFIMQSRPEVQEQLHTEAPERSTSSPPSHTNQPSPAPASTAAYNAVIMQRAQSARMVEDAKRELELRASATMGAIPRDHGSIHASPPRSTIVRASSSPQMSAPVARAPSAVAVAPRESPLADTTHREDDAPVAYTHALEEDVAELQRQLNETKHALFRSETNARLLRMDVRASASPTGSRKSVTPQRTGAALRAVQSEAVMSGSRASSRASSAARERAAPAVTMHAATSGTSDAGQLRRATTAVPSYVYAHARAPDVAHLVSPPPSVERAQSHASMRAASSHALMPVSSVAAVTDGAVLEPPAREQDAHGYAAAPLHESRGGSTSMSFSGRSGATGAGPMRMAQSWAAPPAAHAQQPQQRAPTGGGSSSNTSSAVMPASGGSAYPLRTALSHITEVSEFSDAPRRRRSAASMESGSSEGTTAVELGTISSSMDVLAMGPQSRGGTTSRSASYRATEASSRGLTSTPSPQAAAPPLPPVPELPQHDEFDYANISLEDLAAFVAAAESAPPPTQQQQQQPSQQQQRAASASFQVGDRRQPARALHASASSPALGREAAGSHDTSLGGSSTGTIERLRAEMADARRVFAARSQ